MSLSANLLLAGAVVFWALRNGHTAELQHNSADAPGTTSRRLPSGSPNARGDGAFRWRQLESPDYPTYIANLRAVECPERTIRDIIRADVHALYQQRHAALDRGHRPDGEVTLARRLKAQQVLEQSHARLRQEESSVLLALLGPSEELTSEESQTSAPSAPPPADSQIIMPVVFQDVDLEKLHFSPDQLQAITSLRTQFVESVGGPNQDPSDPGYRARWQESQPEFDDLLRGMLGTEDYENYQIAARIKADAKRRR